MKKFESERYFRKEMCRVLVDVCVAGVRECDVHLGDGL